LKKYLSILVCLILLFLNISVVANAASETTAPTTPITATPTTKTKTTTTATVLPEVNFISNGGSEVAGISVEYNGKAVKPLDPTKIGYTFGGWYKDNNTFAEPFNF